MGVVKLHLSVRRARLYYTAVVVSILALTVTACSAAGVRLLGTSAASSPKAANLDALVVDAASSARSAATPPSSGDSAIAAAPDRFNGPARLRPPPAQLRARPSGTQSGTWAVVIGINDYPGTGHDLDSAVPDALDMDRALGGFGVAADHRLVITDGQATARVIGAAVDWLADRAGPDAVAVFFFAGHVRKTAATKEAMVGADGAVVTDAQLAGRLARLRARRVWVAMASCFGGGFTEVLRPGVVLTGAAGAGDRAYENAAFNRSYMVEYMVRQAMIEGRASSSVQAAYAYARDALGRDYPNRLPVELDNGSGPIDLRPPGAAPPTASASGSSGTASSSSSSDSGAQATTTTTTTSTPPPPPPRHCTSAVLVTAC